MSAEHSATPWNVDDGYGTSIERQEDGERFHIADCTSEYGMPRDKANARHIVRCVNERDELLGFLRDTTNMLHAASMVVTDDVARGIALGVVKAAREALAKAAK